MTKATDMPKTIHQDRNVKHFREMLGIKQEALAFDLGDDWNEKKNLPWNKRKKLSRNY